MFLVRIYDSIGYYIATVGKIIRGLYGFILFACLYVLFIASLYMVLETDVGSEYEDVWGPMKWVTFTLRNTLSDF